MTARPRITLKIASSLDGRIATRAGESKWITCPAAREAGHRLRAAHDAILVGSGTALADDPELNARLDPPAPRQPLRAILDTRLRTSPRSRLFSADPAGPIVIFAGRAADHGAADALAAAGAEVALVPSDVDGVDLDAVLAHLKDKRGVETLLIEGGGGVSASFLAAGLVDRLEWFRAPMLLGAEGKAAVADLKVEQLDRAPRFRRTGAREAGEDLWESYERA